MHGCNLLIRGDFNGNYFCSLLFSFVLLGSSYYNDFQILAIFLHRISFLFHVCFISVSCLLRCCFIDAHCCSSFAPISAEGRFWLYFHFFHYAALTLISQIRYIKNSFVMLKLGEVGAVVGVRRCERHVEATASARRDSCFTSCTKGNRSEPWRIQVNQARAMSREGTEWSNCFLNISTSQCRRKAFSERRL